MENLFPPRLLIPTFIVKRRRQMLATNLDVQTRGKLNLRKFPILSSHRTLSSETLILSRNHWRSLGRILKVMSHIVMVFDLKSNIIFEFTILLENSYQFHDVVWSHSFTDYSYRFLYIYEHMQYEITLSSVTKYILKIPIISQPLI